MIPTIMQKFAHNRFLLGALLCLVLRPAGAVTTPYEPAPFSDYQPILERMPFGAPPPASAPAADAAAQPTDAQTQAEQQKLAKQVNMSCINVTPDGGTAIGFTDLESKPPVNYYLLVGATAGDWTVVKADYDEEWAQIEKAGVTITLKLGKGLIDAPPASAATQTNAVAGALTTAAAAATSDVPPPLAPPRIQRPSQAGRPLIPNMLNARLGIAEAKQNRDEMEKIKSEGGDVNSYMERLRERKKQEYEAKKTAENAAKEQLQDLARKVTEAELKKKEREMNLKLIEQGANPISNIELTAEEEQALIDKGVLAQ